MKKRIIILLFSCLVVGFLYQGCWGKYRCVETFYRLNELKIDEVISSSGTEWHQFYLKDSTAIDTIAASDSLIMLLAFSTEFYSQNIPNFDWNFSLFPTANAKILPCVQGEKGTSEKIVDISISSDNDFDAEHLKNQSLNDFFMSFNTEKEVFDISLNEHLAQIYATEPNMSFMHTIIGQNHFILLKKRPLIGTKHVFTVSITYSDGRKFTHKSPQILFL